MTLPEQGAFNEQLTSILAEHIEHNVRNGMRFGAKQEREKIAIFPFSIDEPVGELRDAIMHLIKQHREAYALEENKNGFFAACGVCGVENTEKTEEYYRMYRAELREKVGK